MSKKNISYNSSNELQMHIIYLVNKLFSVMSTASFISPTRWHFYSTFSLVAWMAYHLLKKYSNENWKTLYKGTPKFIFLDHQYTPCKIKHLLILLFRYKSICKVMAPSSTFFQLHLSNKYKRQIALDTIEGNLLVFCVLILSVFSIKVLKMQTS